MPPALKGGFLTMLYALRHVADSSGKLCFKDGKAIRIQDLAKAAGCREKDARRYLDAAVLAGLVVVRGERRRGVPTLYVLNPLRGDEWAPDWDAAAHHLKATARTRSTPSPDQESSGHSGPNSSEESSGHSGLNQFGPQRPEPVRATAARMGSGHSGPIGSGHSGPNNPGVTQGVTQVVVDVGTQPQVVGGSDEQTDQPSTPHENDTPYGRCEVCRKALIRPGSPRCVDHRETPMPGQRRGARGRQRVIQPPLMAPVPTGPEQPVTDAPLPQWQPEDPTAPQHTCGCGRTYRAHQSGRCQECEHAQPLEVSAG